MYIMDVIRQADRLYPNEFTLDEKIGWIDELNAKISQEYNKQYGMVHLHADRRGEFLLPEDIDYERIHAIRVGAKEIKKENFTTYGVRFIYGHRNILAIPEHIHRAKDIVTVIYLKPPEHIRVVKIEDDDRSQIRCDIIHQNGFYIDNVIFYEGDVLNVKIYRDSKRTEIIHDEDINVIGTTLPDEVGTEFFVECVKNDGSDISEIAAYVVNELPVTIMRHITEKTICDMPYDEMFVQWVCARICQWQREFKGYNQHMTMFNQLLSDYWHWVMERRPSDDNVQWKGWI